MKRKIFFCALLVCLMLAGAHQANAQETSKAFIPNFIENFSIINYSGSWI